MAIKKLLIKLGVVGDKKAKDKIKGVESGLGSLGKSALKAGAAFFGARALINGMKQSVELAGIQEQAEKRLEVALGKRSQALLDQASALQQQTTFGDEAILGVQASISAFVKSEEQIKKATSATLDMAVAMGMDLKSSGDLIAKTLGSSTNALSRYGIQVEGAVGSQERLESLTTNIAKLFGGQATAQADTFAGSIEQMQNAIGDTGEVLGKLFQPAIQSSAKSLKTFAENFGKTLTAISKIDLAKTGKNFLKSTDALMKAVKGLIKITFDFLPDFFKASLNKMLPISKKIFTAFIEGVKEVALIAFEPLVITFTHIGQRLKQYWVTVINGLLGGVNLLIEKVNLVGTKLGFDEIPQVNLLDSVQVDPLLDKLKEAKISKFLVPESGDIDTTQEFLDASAEIMTTYFEQIKVMKEEEKEKDLKDTIDNEKDKADARKKALFEFTDAEKKKIGVFRDRIKASISLADTLAKHRKQLRDNELNQEIQNILKSKMSEEEKESAIANLKERFKQKEIADARKMKAVRKAEAIINTAEAVTKFLGRPIMMALVAAKGAAEIATIEAQQFAKGGIVQGNPSQGDVVPVMATAGELILNQAQQDNLASGMGGVTINIGGNIIGEESFVRDTLIPEIERAEVLA
jgi:hypothetical protein|tara:strand:+ start:1450 stop:3357 length:1908 start_codon:yes stop_codon:yes gene_type:complete